MFSLKLEFWAKNDKSVILIGRSGVGKTAIIRESLEHYGYKFGEDIAYYSTHSNDFIGDSTTAKVILFDNLNDPMAQKAVQEVSGLRVWKGVPVVGRVWGAFTITDVEVEVEIPSVGKSAFDSRKRTEFVKNEVPCPPDVIACFEVKVEVPSRPSLQYLKEKFGDRLANAAVQWWEELGDDYKDLVSPRCLADGLTMYQQRGDMRDILPITSNVSKLVQLLNSGPITEKLDAILKCNDEADARKWLANENNYATAMKYITKSDILKAYFLPLLSEVRLQTIMADDDKTTDFILNSLETNLYFRDICKNIINENTKPRLCKKIRRFLENKQDETHAAALAKKQDENVDQ